MTIITDNTNKMNLTLKQSLTIKPSKPTPYQHIWNSNLDLVVGRIHIQTVYFYRPNGSSNFFDTNVLKQSLAEVLVSFYPMSGRLGKDEKGRINIVCNGEGVLFVEAEADCCIDDFGQITPSPEIGRLVPTVDCSGDVSSYPLFMTQMGGQSGDAMEWTEDCVKFFLELLSEKVKKDPNSAPTLKLSDWNEIDEKIFLRFALKYGSDKLKAKYHRLKAIHTKFSELINKTGVTWDAETGLVFATDEVWSVYIKQNKAFSAIKKKGCKIYPLLSTVFSKSTASGTFHNASTTAPLTSPEEHRLEEEFLGDAESEGGSCGGKKHQLVIAWLPLMQYHLLANALTTKQLITSMMLIGGTFLCLCLKIGGRIGLMIWTTNAICLFCDYPVYV